MQEVTRKRRPAFDREDGVARAQDLFHKHGYDAVSVADLTKTLGINPPSLYAAYGSKADLFNRAMLRYVSKDDLPLAEILHPERPPVEALSDLLITSAKHYTRDPHLRGCMVTEAMRADDEAARNMAAALAKGGSDAIFNFIKKSHPKIARRVADYVLLTMRGLSSFASLGLSRERLVASATLAASSLEQEFSGLHITPGRSKNPRRGNGAS
jgi:TetR/AcrR family transcriptional repressor for divergent bdcA